MRNHTDDVLKELWSAKDSNAKKQGSLELYMKKVLALQAKMNSVAKTHLHTKSSKTKTKTSRLKSPAVAA